MWKHDVKTMPLYIIYEYLDGKHAINMETTPMCMHYNMTLDLLPIIQPPVMVMLDK